jgi:hypothetical protein
MGQRSVLLVRQDHLAVGDSRQAVDLTATRQRGRELVVAEPELEEQTLAETVSLES